MGGQAANCILGKEGVEENRSEAQVKQEVRDMKLLPWFADVATLPGD